MHNETLLKNHHKKGGAADTVFAVKHNLQRTNKSQEEYSQKTIYTEPQGDS